MNREQTDSNSMLTFKLSEFLQLSRRLLTEWEVTDQLVKMQLYMGMRGDTCLFPFCVNVMASCCDDHIGDYDDDMPRWRW